MIRLFKSSQIHDAKQAKELYEYMKIKTKFYKNNTGIRYNKEDLNKCIIEKLCVSLFNYQNYTKMHGTKNVKFLVLSDVAVQLVELLHIIWDKAGLTLDSKTTLFFIHSRQINC